MYTMVVVIYNRKVCKMAIFGGGLKICKYQLTVTGSVSDLLLTRE
jgi:hypothetical protein